MNVYERFHAKIQEANLCDRTRWYFMLDKCPVSSLESIAKDRNDARNTMAREILYDIFINVFSDKSPKPSVLYPHLKMWVCNGFGETELKNKARALSSA